MNPLTQLTCTVININDNTRLVANLFSKRTLTLSLTLTRLEISMPECKGCYLPLVVLVVVVVLAVVVAVVVVAATRKSKNEMNVETMNA